MSEIDPVEFGRLTAQMENLVKVVEEQTKTIKELRSAVSELEQLRAKGWGLLLGAAIVGIALERGVSGLVGIAHGLFK